MPPVFARRHADAAAEFRGEIEGVRVTDRGGNLFDGEFFALEQMPGATHPQFEKHPVRRSVEITAELPRQVGGGAAAAFRHQFPRPVEAGILFKLPAEQGEYFRDVLPRRLRPQILQQFEGVQRVLLRGGGIPGFGEFVEPDRMVLIYATNALNNKMCFTSPDMTTLDYIGDTPVLLERGRFVVTVSNRNGDQLKLYPLDMAGKRLKEILPQKTTETQAVFQIDTGRDGAAVFFEISK